MRSLINTLGSSEDLSVPIQIRLYNSKKEGSEGKPRVWIGQYNDGLNADPVRLDWSLTWEEQEELTEIIESKNKKGDVIKSEPDYSGLIEKLKQVVSELNIDKGVPAAQASYDGVQEISSPAPSSSPKENPMEKLSAVLDDDDTSEQETASVEDQGEVDDLPF